MRYVSARFEQNRRDEMYRIYVTDTLKLIGHIDQRYYDFVKPEKVETRTAEEIIENISNELNALVVKDGRI